MNEILVTTRIKVPIVKTCNGIGADKKYVSFSYHSKILWQPFNRFGSLPTILQ